MKRRVGAEEKLRPDLMIDGPLRYDAAVMADVAKSSAELAGCRLSATVFISRITNAGSTTYKAVQRSADLISIGPMLPGYAQAGERPVPVARWLTISSIPSPDDAIGLPNFRGNGKVNAGWRRDALSDLGGWL